MIGYLLLLLLLLGLIGIFIGFYIESVVGMYFSKRTRQMTISKDAFDLWDDFEMKELSQEKLNKFIINKFSEIDKKIDCIEKSFVQENTKLRTKIDQLENKK